MVAWCRGGGRCVNMSIDVSKDLAVEERGVIVIMNNINIEYFIS